MTQFSFLRRLALSAAGLTLLPTAAACSSSDSADSGSEKPVAGGQVTYLVDQTQLTLDPAISPATVTGLIDRNIFDSLVAQTGPSEFKPWLAENWSISPDGRIYTFALKKGVKFTDGTAFDANSVKTTLDHVVDPKTKSQYAASLIAAAIGIARPSKVVRSRPASSFMTSTIRATSTVSP